MAFALSVFVAWLLGLVVWCLVLSVFACIELACIELAFIERVCLDLFSAWTCFRLQFARLSWLVYLLDCKLVYLLDCKNWTARLHLSLEDVMLGLIGLQELDCKTPFITGGCDAWSNSSALFES